jgi:tetratricopeptide (TPR) repeat protein
MRLITVIIIMLFSIAWQNTSVARDEVWKNNTNLLPQYCKDFAAGLNKKKWRSIFGDLYIHTHHYCKGVFAEQKAKSALNQRERASWLQKVGSQMKYVSGACDSRCVMYPDLHTRWGWALGKQGQVAEAIKHYQMAFRAKRNYTPAYAGLADLYLEVRQPEEARKVLEQGLKARPKSRSLKRRLDELATSG